MSGAALETPGGLLAHAVEAARRAGRVLADRFSSPRTIEYKGNIDLVTDADKAAEAALLAYIRSVYPHHAILAEESGASGQSGGLRWIVDPLDGTTNYAHQIPHFCVSVGVDGPDGLMAGAVYDPVRNELFAAARGLGATLNGRPIKPSPQGELSRALLSTGFPYDIQAKPELPLQFLGHFIRRVQGVRRMGSAALDLAYVACGRYDGFFEFGLKPWDIAAGALLIEEAGGVARRIDGGPLDLQRGHVVAAAPGLSEALLRSCAERLAELGWKME